MGRRRPRGAAAERWRCIVQHTLWCAACAAAAGFGVNYSTAPYALLLIVHAACHRRLRWHMLAARTGLTRRVSADPTTAAVVCSALFASAKLTFIALVAAADVNDNSVRRWYRHHQNDLRDDWGVTLWRADRQTLLRSVIPAAAVLVTVLLRCCWGFSRREVSGVQWSWRAIAAHDSRPERQPLLSELYNGSQQLSQLQWWAVLLVFALLPGVVSVCWPCALTAPFAATFLLLSLGVSQRGWMRTMGNHGWLGRHLRPADFRRIAVVALVVYLLLLTVHMLVQLPFARSWFEHSAARRSLNIVGLLRYTDFTTADPADQPSGSERRRYLAHLLLMFFTAAMAWWLAFDISDALEEYSRRTSRRGAPSTAAHSEAQSSVGGGGGWMRRLRMLRVELRQLVLPALAIALAIVAVVDPSFLSLLWMLFFIFLLWRSIMGSGASSGLPLRFAMAAGVLQMVMTFVVSIPGLVRASDASQRVLEALGLESHTGDRVVLVLGAHAVLVLSIATAQHIESNPTPVPGSRQHWGRPPTSLLEDGLADPASGLSAPGLRGRAWSTGPLASRGDTAKHDPNFAPTARQGDRDVFSPTLRCQESAADFTVTQPVLPRKGSSEGHPPFGNSSVATGEAAAAPAFPSPDPPAKSPAPSSPVPPPSPGGGVQIREEYGSVRRTRSSGSPVRSADYDDPTGSPPRSPARTTRMAASFASARTRMASALPSAFSWLLWQRRYFGWLRDKAQYVSLLLVVVAGCTSVDIVHGVLVLFFLVLSFSKEVCRKLWLLVVAYSVFIAVSLYIYTVYVKVWGTPAHIGGVEAELVFRRALSRPMWQMLLYLALIALSIGQLRIYHSMPVGGDPMPNPQAQQAPDNRDPLAALKAWRVFELAESTLRDPSARPSVVLLLVWVCMACFVVFAEPTMVSLGYCIVLVAVSAASVGRLCRRSCLGSTVKVGMVWSALVFIALYTYQFNDLKGHLDDGANAVFGCNTTGVTSKDTTVCVRQLGLRIGPGEQSNVSLFLALMPHWIVFALMRVSVKWLKDKHKYRPDTLGPPSLRTARSLFAAGPTSPARPRVDGLQQVAAGLRRALAAMSPWFLCFSLYAASTQSRSLLADLYWLMSAATLLQVVRGRRGLPGLYAVWAALCLLIKMLWQLQFFAKTVDLHEQLTDAEFLYFCGLRRAPTGWACSTQEDAASCGDFQGCGWVNGTDMCDSSGHTTMRDVVWSDTLVFAASLLDLARGGWSNDEAPTVFPPSYHRDPSSGQGLHPASNLSRASRSTRRNSGSPYLYYPGCEQQCFDALDTDAADATVALAAVVAARAASGWWPGLRRKLRANWRVLRHHVALAVDYGTARHGHAAVTLTLLCSAALRPRQLVSLFELGLFAVWVRQSYFPRRLGLATVAAAAVTYVTHQFFFVGLPPKYKDTRPWDHDPSGTSSVDAPAGVPYYRYLGAYPDRGDLLADFVLLVLALSALRHASSEDHPPTDLRLPDGGQRLQVMADFLDAPYEPSEDMKSMLTAFSHTRQPVDFASFGRTPMLHGLQQRDPDSPEFDFVKLAASFEVLQLGGTQRTHRTEPRAASGRRHSPIASPAASGRSFNSYVSDPEASLRSSPLGEKDEPQSRTRRQALMAARRKLFRLTLDLLPEAVDALLQEARRCPRDNMYLALPDDAAGDMLRSAGLCDGMRIVTVGGKDAVDWDTIERCLEEQGQVEPVAVEVMYKPWIDEILPPDTGLPNYLEHPRNWLEKGFSLGVRFLRHLVLLLVLIDGVSAEAINLLRLGKLALCLYYGLRWNHVPWKGNRAWMLMLNYYTAEFILHLVWNLHALATSWEQHKVLRKLYVLAGLIDCGDASVDTSAEEEQCSLIQITPFQVVIVALIYMQKLAFDNFVQVYVLRALHGKEHDAVEKKALVVKETQQRAEQAKQAALEQDEQRSKVLRDTEAALDREEQGAKEGQFPLPHLFDSPEDTPRRRQRKRRQQAALVAGARAAEEQRSPRRGSAGPAPGAVTPPLEYTAPQLRGLFEHGRNLRLWVPRRYSSGELRWLFVAGLAAGPDAEGDDALAGRPPDEAEAWRAGADASLIMARSSLSLLRTQLATAGTYGAARQEVDGESPRDAPQEGEEGQSQLGQQQQQQHPAEETAAEAGCCGSLLTSLTLRLHDVALLRDPDVLCPRLGPEAGEREKAARRLKVRRKLGAHLTGALLLHFQEHSAWWCIVLFTINFAVSVSLCDMVPSLSALLYALLVGPRPSPRYWGIVLTYMELIVGLKCFFQGLQTTFGVVVPSVLLGSLKRGRFLRNIFPDLCAIVSVIFHRRVLLHWGLHRATPRYTETDVDYAHKMTRVHTLQARAARYAQRLKHHFQNVMLLPEDGTPCIEGMRFVQRDKERTAQIRPDPKDLYLTGIVLETLFIVLFVTQYSTFEGTDSFQLSDAIAQNLLPGPLVLLTFIFLLLMAVERAIYLNRSMPLAYMLHCTLVLLYHFGFFFWYWQRTEKDYIGVSQTKAHNVGGMLFFVKCVGLFVNAAQIRAGYPTYLRHDCFTETLSVTGFLGEWGPWVAYWLYNYVFRLIPFLWELRVLLDWACARTSLKKAYWLKLEDLRHEMYMRKIDRIDSSWTNPEPGSRYPEFYKFCGGWLCCSFIYVVIFLPLFIYSTFSPVLEKNSVQQLSVEVGFDSAPPLYANQLQVQGSTNDSLSSYIEYTYADMRQYEISSSHKNLQLVELPFYSAEQWRISAQARAHFIDLLAAGNGTAPQGSLPDLVLRVNLRRSSGGANNQLQLPAPDRRYDYGPTEQSDGTPTRARLAQLLNCTHNCADLPPVELKEFFSPFLLNRPSSVEMVVTNSVTQNCNLSAMGSGYGNKNYQLSCTSLFACGNYPCKSFKPEKCYFRSDFANNCTDYIRDRVKHPHPHCPAPALEACGGHENAGPYFSVVSYLVANDSNALTGFFNIGIIALFATYVLAVSRLLRSVTAGTANAVIIQDMDDPEPVDTLIRHIHLAQQAGEFEKEERIYLRLINLLRQAETLALTTGMRRPPKGSKPPPAPRPQPPPPPSSPLQVEVAD
eukprot:TRINITY_DN10881_c0_g1_i1.p1 TRINITY_DN10881_c0_g1~~TRINITY_DN10881_c0_g1_i1.p1  ORF type:complete len:3070 (+),score=928.96 TRINITY_DN10881_c0_g1_i1:99-9212(+)